MAMVTRLQRPQWFPQSPPSEIQLMLRAQDRSKRPGEGTLRFTVQQLPGEMKHEFVSESLAKSGVLGLYQRWKKSRERKPDDYPECKVILIDNQGMNVLVYSFNDRSLACAVPIIRHAAGAGRLSGRPDCATASGAGPADILRLAARRTAP